MSFLSRLSRPDVIIQDRQRVGETLFNYSKIFNNISIKDIIDLPVPLIQSYINAYKHYQDSEQTNEDS